MDPTANNYNILATLDDGSCCGGSYGGLGCIDCSQLNYDPNHPLDCGDPSLCNAPTPPTASLIGPTIQTIGGSVFTLGSSTSSGSVTTIMSGNSDDTDWLDVWNNYIYPNNTYTTIGDNSKIEFVGNNGGTTLIYNGATTNGKIAIYNLISTPFPSFWNDLYSVTLDYDSSTSTFTCTPGYGGRITPSFNGDGTMQMTVEFDMSNYNSLNNCNVPNVTVTDSFNVVWGCMDDRSPNYNANANAQDCSC
jgi:hypothetical protein